MADETTTNKGFQKPTEGWWARTVLGRDMRTNLDDIDTILGRFEREEHTLSDAGKTALLGGNRVDAIIYVIGESGHESAAFFLKGTNNSVAKLWESARNTELEATATQDQGSISGGDTGTFTVTVTGAATGDPVAVSPPSGINADLSVTARVTSANTVTVVITNPTSGAIDPASGDYTVKVFDQSTSYTTTEDNDTTTNVYWDSGNTRYELNNETGGSATYEVIALRAV